MSDSRMINDCQAQWDQDEDTTITPLPPAEQPKPPFEVRLVRTIEQLRREMAEDPECDWTDLIERMEAYLRSVSE